MNMLKSMAVTLAATLLLVACASNDEIYFDPGFAADKTLVCPESMEDLDDADRALFWGCDTPSDSDHCCTSVTRKLHCHSYNCGGSKCSAWCAAN